MLSQSLAFLALWATGSLAAKSCKATSEHASIVAPEGSIVIDSSGATSGSYSTFGKAVAALNDSTVDEQVIFVLPGTYEEQVYIPSLAGPLKIQGYTCDKRSYADNQVTLTNNLSRQTANITNNDKTATLRIWSSEVKLYNLNVANTFGAAATNGQALALSAQETDLGFYGCSFEGWQDTIYANEGRQIYANTYINGAVDFIFGLRAAAWFENCDIETIGTGYITANGRDSEENTSYYVFNDCTVTGTSGANSTYLGRPWRPYSRVVFQKSYLGDVIHPEGWSRWDDTQSVANISYHEYKNRGPGSKGVRANFSSPITTAIKPTEILGANFRSEWWVDSYYL